MNFTLTRNEPTAAGIFGVLASEDYAFYCKTLEHAYPADPTTGAVFTAKIPNGTYTCVRGQHQLKNMTHPFETFQITNVPGHSNILFHAGNFNADSEGCVLLGLGQVGEAYITDSRRAFDAFMHFLTGLNSFELTVSETYSF